MVSFHVYVAVNVSTSQCIITVSFYVCVPPCCSLLRQDTRTPLMKFNGIRCLCHVCQCPMAMGVHSLTLNCSMNFAIPMLMQYIAERCPRIFKPPPSLLLSRNEESSTSYMSIMLFYSRSRSQPLLP